MNPYLLQLGFIERTPRGRLATQRAYAHLGLQIPDRQTPSIIYIILKKLNEFIIFYRLLVDIRKIAVIY